MAKNLMEALAELGSKEAQDKALADIQAKADALVEEAGATVGKLDDPDATHTWDKGVLTKIERGVIPGTPDPDPDFVPNVIDPDDPDQVAFGIWLESIGKLDVFINKEKGWGILWDQWMTKTPVEKQKHWDRLQEEIKEAIDRDEVDNFWCRNIL